MSDPKSILYVEDNPENRMLIQRILQAEGYQVQFAQDASEAMNLVESTQFDLILMDINLPDIDGYTLTARLRSFPKTASTPIVALTANVMKGDREKSLDSGCDGYIQKPIDVDELPFQVATFLKR